MGNGVQLTLEEWMPQIFQKQTVGALEHPVKISPLPEKGEDLRETDHRSLEKYLESLKRSGKRISLNGSSMKTLRECFQATEDLTSCPYSLSWMWGGTTLNGNYLTLNCTEYHKTESEFILLDILEKKVPEKYFLSRQQMEKIVFNSESKE